MERYVRYDDPSIVYVVVGIATDLRNPNQEKEIVVYHREGFVGELLYLSKEEFYGVISLPRFTKLSELENAKEDGKVLVSNIDNNLIRNGLKYGSHLIDASGHCEISLSSFSDPHEITFYKEVDEGKVTIVDILYVCGTFVKTCAGRVVGSYNSYNGIVEFRRDGLAIHGFDYFVVYSNT
jgi:hypothetical protein